MAPIDHLLFFKVKPGTPAEGVDAFVSSLRALASLDCVTELYVGAALGESRHGWTHGLYGRYPSKEALNAYMVSDEHQHAVKTHVRPIMDDSICLDWEAEEEEGGPSAAAAAGRAGAVHALVMNLKEGVEGAKAAAMGARVRSHIGAIPGLQRVSVGENFTFGRDKGFKWGMVAALSSEAALAGYATHEEHVKFKDEFFPFVADAMVLDFEAGPELPAKI